MMYYFIRWNVNPLLLFFFFFFNDTATTEIYTLSLHDALPICQDAAGRELRLEAEGLLARVFQHEIDHLDGVLILDRTRSEEHTSELQSRQYLVCRLLLEKKNTKHTVKSTTDKQHTRHDLHGQ